jgi:hypothetical protein
MNSNLYRTPWCSLPACYEAPRLCSCFQERYLISLQPPSSTPMSHRSQNTISRRGFEPAAMDLLSLKRSSAIWLQEPKIRSFVKLQSNVRHCSNKRKQTRVLCLSLVRYLSGQTEKQSDKKKKQSPQNRSPSKRTLFNIRSWKKLKHRSSKRRSQILTKSEE